MNLTELNKSQTAKQLAENLKKFHGIVIPVEQLNHASASRLLENTQEKIRNFRKTPEFHESEQNRDYLALLLVEQTLSTLLTEDVGDALSSGAKAIKGELTKTIPGADVDPYYPLEKGKMPKLTGIVDQFGNKTKSQPVSSETKSTLIDTLSTNQDYLIFHTDLTKKEFQSFLTLLRNLNITTQAALVGFLKKNQNQIKISSKELDLRKLMGLLQKNEIPKILHNKEFLSNFNQLIKSINNMIKLKKPLTESVLSDAEVILAAKDLVDRLQDMVEELGKMTNEELPALTETIRDSMNPDSAEKFNTSAQETIDALLTAAKEARQSMTMAARELAGEEVTPPTTEPSEEDLEDLVEPEETKLSVKKKSLKPEIGRAKR